MTVLGYIKDVFVRPKQYAKFWVGLASAILTALLVNYSDNTWLQSFVPFLGTLGIFAVPNKK